MRLYVEFDNRDFFELDPKTKVVLLGFYCKNPKDFDLEKRADKAIDLLSHKFGLNIKTRGKFEPVLLSLGLKIFQIKARLVLGG